MFGLISFNFCKSSARSGSMSLFIHSSIIIFQIRSNFQGNNLQIHLRKLWKSINTEMTYFLTNFVAPLIMSFVFFRSTQEITYSLN